MFCFSHFAVIRTKGEVRIILGNSSGVDFREYFTVLDLILYARKRKDISFCICLFEVQIINSNREFMRAKMECPVTKAFITTVNKNLVYFTLMSYGCLFLCLSSITSVIFEYLSKEFL
jgi:hypothetical protein